MVYFVNIQKPPEKPIITMFYTRCCPTFFIPILVFQSVRLNTYQIFIVLQLMIFIFLYQNWL